MSNLDKFKGMSKEEFLGSPRIIPDRKNMTRLFVPARCEKSPVEMILGLQMYQARFGKDACVLQDGDKVIATYVCSREPYLVVDPTYRGKGIGVAIMYEMCVREGGLKKGSLRTATLQRICERVWDRIQAELTSESSPPVQSPSP